jgi:Uma2 family endonuclease
MTTIAERLLTAEEYYLLPDNGQPTELVRGRIVPLNMPYPRHGEICVKVVRILGRFLDDHDIGRLVSNDSGIVTERGPDTVRGGDVEFYSYSRVPRGPLPRGYLTVVPELVIEVRSPGDRWGRIMTKVGEYLEAGVTLVCVLDEQTETARVYRQEEPPEQVFTADQDLILPEVLPDFRVPVRRFFE